MVLLLLLWPLFLLAGSVIAVVVVVVVVVGASVDVSLRTVSFRFCGVATATTTLPRLS